MTDFSRSEHPSAATDLQPRGLRPVELPDRMPRRHRLPWATEDFEALMQACRSDCSIEEIAGRVGRTLASVRPQLRRLLPVDERHLPTDLVPARLRQLDRDGDYDWLEAVSQRTVPPWEVQQQEQAESHARGIGALTDDDLVAVTLAMATCLAPVSPEIRSRFARELRERDLEGQLQRSVSSVADDATRDFFGFDPGLRIPDAAYWARDWRD
ncbi:hypothetical protein [Agrococcus sp. Ld7]|uniref:hypothetical protein n=1 Tax=Agrococcus sp. Ld7 TaxID=649148 RepID=UPI0038689EFF